MASNTCCPIHAGAVLALFLALAAIQFVVSQSLPASSYVTPVGQVMTWLIGPSDTRRMSVRWRLCLQMQRGRSQGVWHHSSVSVLPSGQLCKSCAAPGPDKFELTCRILDPRASACGGNPDHHSAATLPCAQLIMASYFSVFFVGVESLIAFKLTIYCVLTRQCATTAVGPVLCLRPWQAQNLRIRLRDVCH